MKGGNGTGVNLGTEVFLPGFYLALPLSMPGQCWSQRKAGLVFDTSVAPAHEPDPFYKHHVGNR